MNAKSPGSFSIVVSLALSACAPSGEYMGIDTRIMPVAAPVTPEQAGAVRARTILVLLAAVEGCYDRVPGGFRVVRAIEAKSFECAEMLVAIENLGDALGDGFGPASDPKVALASIARRASAGDKHAQLELGIRFEEGIGVAVDRKKARKLYAQAATVSGGTLWVYSPPVGNGTSGRVIPVDRGPRQAGLAEAKRRLAALDQSAEPAR